MEDAKAKFKEEEFYEPLKKWLESEGYSALVTAGKKQILLITGPLLGVGYLEPDVIGYKKEGYEEYLTIIEAKADPMYIFDGLGRCYVYQTVADYVYLALPKKLAEKIGPGSFFEREFRIGILSVNKVNDKIDVEVKIRAQRIYSHRHEMRMVLMDMVKAALNIRR